MIDPRPAATADVGSHVRYQILRELGARAHQLRAAARAADHFVAQGVDEDRNTGSWLMSSAVALAAEVAADIDSLARGLREAPADAAFAQAVQSLRIRAHQLHAAARAADRFLDLDSRDDRDCGPWLISFARGLAERLAAETDDCTGRLKRPAPEAGAEALDARDAAVMRRVLAATAPMHGVA